MKDAIARPPRRDLWRIAGLGFVFFWFFAGGAGHFLMTRMFVSIVPPYAPFPLEMVWFTGACEIAGALALLHPKLRRISGLCLIALAICVTPVHIEMLIQAERHAAIGLPVLWGRLLFQPVLIWIIWTVTTPWQARPGSATLG